MEKLMDIQQTPRKMSFFYKILTLKGFAGFGMFQQGWLGFEIFNLVCNNSLVDCIKK